MPTYNGESIFGIASSFITTSTATRVQRNAYPGVHGVERLNLGNTGRITVVSGLLYGTLAAIQAVWTKWENYKTAGTAHTLVNNAGETYTNVVVTAFEWSEDYVPENATEWTREYRLTLEHLV